MAGTTDPTQTARTVEVSAAGRTALLFVNNPPVNALSESVRVSLLKNLRMFRDDSSIDSVVIGGVGSKFIAGADIREFDKPIIDPALPEIFNLIEAFEKPVVAAIGGFALGGGLELALACHARVAAANAKLGLPEVTLGIIPGAGGTQRLIRLVDPAFAADLVTSGRSMDAAQALKIGLIEEIQDENHLLRSAVDFSRKLIGKPLRRLSQCPVVKFDPEELKSVSERVRKRARGQLSVQKALEVVTKGISLSFEEGSRLERQTFLELRASGQAKALRHLFFAERQAAVIPELDPKAARSISSVGVVGAGTMGTGIATACLMKGFNVILVEPNDDVRNRARDKIAQSLADHQKRAKNSGATTANDQITFSSSLDDLNQCDLVIEAIFEDEAAKLALIKKLDTILDPSAVLATNTSYLDVNRLSSATSHPAQFIGLHFFAPADKMRLVEVIRGQQSAPGNVATGMKFARALGKLPIISGVCDGFIVNRILSIYRRDMEYALEDGAFPHEVDAALENFGMAMGPFSVSDLSGLDIAWARRKRLSATRRADERYVPVADQLCEAGRLGRKTSAGWFDYVNTIKAPAPFVAELVQKASLARGIRRRKISDEEIVSRALACMINEAAKILDEGIALRGGDIDLAIVNGLGFPAWRGGPVFFGDEKGLPSVVETVRTMTGSGLQISPLLERCARDGIRLSDFSSVKPTS